jgi:ABC-2 type transport system permease protein
MDLRNVLAFVGKELIQLRRDPAALALALFLPIFAISIVNFGFGDVRDVPMVISDQAGDGQAQTIIGALRHVDTFNIVLEGNMTDSDAKQLVYSGAAKVVVIIPKGTGEVIARDQKANLTVIVDASDEVVYQSIRGGLAQALQDATTKIVNEKVKEQGVAAGQQPIEFVLNEVYGGSGHRVVDAIMPNVIAFMQIYISMSLTQMLIIKEKLGRTLERILASPVRGSEILLGKLIASVIITLGGLAILLVMGFWVFGIEMAGSVWALFWLVLLIGLGGLGLGLAASAIAKREVEATMILVAYITPSMLMSGFLWPLEAMSPMLRSLAYIVPLTYANHALRAVMLGGQSLWSVASDIVILGAFAAATIVAGTLMFRRELVAQA